MGDRLYERICIDGIQTYVLQRDKLVQLLSDMEQPEQFHKCVSWHMEHRDGIEEITAVKLYPAVLHNERIDLRAYEEQEIKQRWI